jgi:4-amino-4-deoxy-L-arabinose transferase-like glycosyltransferase
MQAADMAASIHSTSAQSASQDWLGWASKGLRGYLFVVLAALLAGLPGLTRMAPLDRDESRFAQATVQMLETGDYIRIYVQDDPRHKKPVGIHWLQAASVSAFSDVQAREIWAFRLPSLLGAALGAAAAFWAGQALIGRSAAFAGAALFGVTILLSTEAMIAKTDAVLCGLTTLACAAIARLRMRPPDAPGLALAAIAWSALGAGVLIKGPITPMVAGLMVAALLLFERDRGWARALAHPLGPALALLIALPWLAAIGLATDGAFFREALGGDLAPKLAGGGEHPITPPGLHLALLPFLFFPATIGLLPGLALAAGAFRPAPPFPGAPSPRALKTLIAWAAPAWLVFELMPTKLVHYPLPTYPALALLAGAGLCAMMRPEAARMRLGALLLMAVAAAGMVALSAYLGTLAPGDQEAAARRVLQTALTGGGAAAAMIAAMALIRRADFWVGLALVAGVVNAYAARHSIAPEARTVLISAEADAALRRTGLHPRLDASGGPALLVSGYREPSLVFATRTDTLLLNGAEAAAAAQPGQAALIEGRERAAFTAGLAARGLAFAPASEPVSGLNYSNGDDVALTPGRITPAP